MKPAKSRDPSALEQLKLRLRQFLHRELTPREEHLLELTQPVLEPEMMEEDQADAA